MSGIRFIVLAIGAATASALMMSPAVLAADAAAAASKAPMAVREPQLAKLTAAEIVDRHVAARGGAQTWTTVQTLQLSGKIEAGKGDNVARAQKVINADKKAGGKATSAELAVASADPQSNKQIQLPFTLDLKRPNQMRLEVGFDGTTALQIYDGEHGWKYRPFLHRTAAEPFTEDEAKAEASRGDLDGPLINYAAKGTKVELEGADMVDTRPAYRLKVTAKSGSPSTSGSTPRLSSMSRSRASRSSWTARCIRSTCSSATSVRSRA